MGEFEILGMRLKELRSQLNMNQAQFSALVNVSAATLSAYETGAKNPSLGVLKNIAQKCNVSIDWLCGLREVRTLGGALKKYEDIIAWLFQIEDSCPYKIKIEKIKLSDKENPQEVLYFNDTLMREFLKEWGKMKAVHEGGMVDDEVYALWREKSLRKYQLAIGNYAKGQREGLSNDDVLLVLDPMDGTVGEMPWSFAPE